jgi:hypothetical protein
MGVLAEHDYMPARYHERSSRAWCPDGASLGDCWKQVASWTHLVRLSKGSRMIATGRVYNP